MKSLFFVNSVRDRLRGHQAPRTLTPPRHGPPRPWWPRIRDPSQPSRYDERVTRTQHHASLCIALLLTVPAFDGLAQAQTARNVAVVVNMASQDSQRVAEHYISRRQVPAENIIRIRTASDETISRELYLATIENPIAAALTRQRLQDRVLYLVLTKGVPLRIAGTLGQDGTMSSVDSELTLLYRKLTGQTVPVPGRIDNPYFLGSRPPAQARPFSHRQHDVLLVSRLDAFTVEEALALVDRAQAPTTQGRVVLDQRKRFEDLFNAAGDDLLESAADRLSDLGHGERVVLEDSPSAARVLEPVLGYYSWGSNDPNNRRRSVGLGFVPGSLAAALVSTDARTFEPPPTTWRPGGDAKDKSTWFGGSPESLVGDAIREGVTGVAGHVAQPFVDSMVRPDILFPAYVSGFNLIEAFYLAIPHLGWQTLVIGDPLCAPFPRQAVSSADLDPGLDSATELPAFFSQRRVAMAAAEAPGVPERAVALAVKAEGQTARGERAAARQSLEESTALAPNVPTTQMQLALLLEATGEWQGAEARYARVVALQPNNALALNNLAYSLATRRKAPKQALPLARRAAAAAPKDGMVVDTLAWVEHLLGDIKAAVGHVAQAIALTPRHPEIRLHAAVINAAGGARAVAEAQLAEALKLDPSLEKRPEVRQVRAALAKLAN